MVHPWSYARCCVFEKFLFGSQVFSKALTGTWYFQANAGTTDTKFYCHLTTRFCVYILNSFEVDT